MTASWPFEPLPRLPTLVKVLVLAQSALVSLSGCAAGAPTATDRTVGGRLGESVAGARNGVVTARSGGLTVRLAVVPTLARHGSIVRIEIVMHAQNARGALGYRLRYGDGITTGSGPVPQFCLSGAHRPASQTWRLTHRYSAKGRYLVSASVYVNCTDDHLTAIVPVVAS